MRQLRNARQTDPEFLRKIMRTLFALLGEDNSLTRQYRQRYLDSL